MGKSIFDYDDGDLIFSTSSSLVLDSDGNYDDAFRRQHGAGSRFQRTAWGV